MLRRLSFIFPLALLVLVSALPADAKPKPDPTGSALILYDATGEWAWIGEIHATMLANLLGHFPFSYKVEPVEDYTSGEIENYSATFYIGSSYTCGDTPLPAPFLSDVMATTKPICWFKYNIWHLAWCQQLEFEAKFGFRFYQLIGGWVGDPIYDSVLYNGKSFIKHPGDPEMGWVGILNPAICSEIATASTTLDPEDTIPYVVKGANLWYVADLPFSYIAEEDRYLVFCDLLHDILGVDYPQTKRAILRLEDVGPDSDPDALRDIADYLYQRQVPFAVSVIPFYLDPFGFYNGGVPEYDSLSNEPELVSALKYMTKKGGKIVLHGCTHQYDQLLNPYNGVSGDDFEFYRVLLDDDGFTTVYAGPVPNDSKLWVAKRIRTAVRELRACGLTPIAFEVPHYAASATDYQVFAALFPLTIQRVIYFTDLAMPVHGFTGAGEEPVYFGGQFFPYVIQSDVYGQKVAPENLGSYEPDPWEGYREWLVEDILRCADKNSALRDAWASCYFHPFNPIEPLQEIVEGIQGMGYTFVPLTLGME
jgi:uncharacterized protein YdaL